MEVSKGRIDRLGNSIRDGLMSDDDYQVLRVMRAKWEVAETELKNELVELLKQDEIEVLFRLKKMESIRYKLARYTFKLSRMRDIVGLRVIVTGGRRQQDKVVQEIVSGIRCDRFKVIDRRIAPSEGYRAVHIEITRGLVIAEVQVRTEFQHEWAHLFEVLSKTVGRGTRYGEPPIVGHLSSQVRSSVPTSLKNFRELSFEIARVEILESSTSEIRRKLEIQKILINQLQKGLD